MEIDIDKPRKAAPVADRPLHPGMPRWLKVLRIFVALTPLVVSTISEIADPDVNPLQDAPENALGPLYDLVGYRAD